MIVHVFPYQISNKNYEYNHYIDTNYFIIVMAIICLYFVILFYIEIFISNCVNICL